MNISLSDQSSEATDMDVTASRFGSRPDRSAESFRARARAVDLVTCRARPADVVTAHVLAPRFGVDDAHAFRAVHVYSRHAAFLFSPLLLIAELSGTVNKARE